MSFSSAHWTARRSSSRSGVSAESKCWLVSLLMLCYDFSGYSWGTVPQSAQDLIQRLSGAQFHGIHVSSSC
jgi:hypothetical protein